MSSTRRDFIGVCGAALASGMAAQAAPVRSLLGAEWQSIGGSAPTPPLPYDAEVEYLESDGNQYVQTCITGKDFAEGSVAIEGMPLSLLHSFPVFAGCIPQDSFGFFGVHNNVTQLYSRLSTSASLFGFASDYSVLSNRYLMTVGGGKNVLYADDGTILDEKDVRHDIVPPSAYSNRLGLFGYGNGLRIMNGRIYSAKVWDVNGVVIGDFIPVRFSNEQGVSEGAMYDRVSGELFRNAGTGNFIVGRDTNPISARSYVSDGLVAMWDGIENAGWGVHDAEATTWLDLVGNVDLTLGTNGSWAAKSLEASNGSGYAATGGYVSSASFFELCLRCDTDYNDSINRVVASFKQHMDIGLSLQHGVGCLTSGRRNAFVYDFGRRAFTISANNNSCFINSNAITNIGDSDTWDSFGNGTYLGNYTNGVRPFIGGIYSVRLYSRTLTAAEIAANYAIDKARFNLP